jgi:hypothetical protein
MSGKVGQPQRAMFSPGSAWSMSKLVGVVAAAVAAVSPDRVSRLGQVLFPYDPSSGGGLSLLAQAAHSAGAEIVVIGGVATLAALPFSSVLERGVQSVWQGAADARHRMADFFSGRTPPEGVRRAVLSNDAAVCTALRQALDAAGVRHLAMEMDESMAVLGYSDHIDSALESILAGMEDPGVGATVISLRANGIHAPTAMASASDGTCVALWSAYDGRPIATVGYDVSGAPSWVYTHATGKVERSVEALAGAPLRERAASLMQEAAARSALHYEDMSARMSSASAAGRLRLREDEGTLMLRNAEGFLDSGCGAPAVLAPDGAASWYLNGRAVSREEAEQLAEIAGSPLSRP